MKRILLLVVVALSTVVCLATAGLWIRSYWVMDSVQLSMIRARDGGLHARHVNVTTDRGVFEMGIGWGTITAPGVAEDTRLTHHSRRGLLIFNTMKGTLAERLGFRANSGPSGFMGGRTAQATHTIVNFPHWLVCLATAWPLALYGVHRHRRRSRARAGRCRRCGYDLRASPEHCPECGWTSLG